MSGNVAAAKERLAFADRNIGSARTLAGQAVSGQQSGLVDAVRAAESALGQTRALLDAVDNAASDIRHAVERLPSVMADIKAGIAHATEQLRRPDIKSAHTSELVAARDAATRAVDAAGGGSADPLGTFAQLAKADSDLNRQLATLAEEQAAADRLARSLEQALFTAQSRVRGVSEFIDTRRGSIGPDARTRLAEAQRHLEAAQDKKADQPGRGDCRRQCGVDTGRQRAVAGQRRRDVRAARLHPPRRQRHRRDDRRDHHRRPPQRRNARRIRRLESRVVRRLFELVAGRRIHGWRRAVLRQR